MSASPKKKAATIAAFFILHYSAPVISETTFDVGAHRKFVNYTEYAQDNSFLDSDQGSLNGNVISVRHSLSKWTGILNLTESSGTLNYNAINATSISSINQNALQLSLLRSIYTADKTKASLGLKYEQQTYKRNISNTQRLFGLNETYKYRKTGISGEVEHKFSDSLSLTGQLSYLVDASPTIDVKFLSGDFDETKITLGRTNIGEVSLALKKQVYSKWLLSSQITYSNQKTERSSRKRLSRRGEPLNNFATAPESKNESWELSIAIGYIIK